MVTLAPATSLASSLTPSFCRGDVDNVAKLRRLFLSISSATSSKACTVVKVISYVFPLFIWGNMSIPEVIVVNLL